MCIGVIPIECRKATAEFVCFLKLSQIYKGAWSSWSKTSDCLSENRRFDSGRSRREEKRMYKSFRKQLQECTRTENLVKEKCPWCGKILLLCKKYGGQCISSKCREERTKYPVM